MSKKRVWYFRSIWFDVEADNEESAIEQADELLEEYCDHANEFSCDWELDEVVEV